MVANFNVFPSCVKDEIRCRMYCTNIFVVENMRISLRNSQINQNVEIHKSSKVVTTKAPYSASASIERPYVAFYFSKK